MRDYKIKTNLMQELIKLFDYYYTLWHHVARV